MKWLRLAGTRLVLATGTLFLVSVFIFGAVDMLPGDVASRILGRLATEENRAALREQLHLDRPPLERYVGWLGDIMHGDIGRTMSTDRPIIELLGPRLKNTLMLGALALLLYVPMAAIPAIIQATRRDTWLDHGLSLVTFLLYSIPDFLLGTLLLLLFVVAIPWLPATSIIDDATTGWELIRALILPASTLALVMAVYAVRMLRDNLIEILDTDFIKFATLSGLPRRRIVIRHALPNALIPSLNVTALNIAYLIGGVVVVEKVFSFPGFGSLLVDALLVRDVPLIQITVLIAAATYITANLIADLGAILLNPKLRS
jgi:peptide/nickel transport system permease protein